jgi:hypothetical protein
MSLLFTQRYVADMCKSIDVMKITDRQKDFVRAAFRAAIEFANAKNGMHASQNARDAALAGSSPIRETVK